MNALSLRMITVVLLGIVLTACSPREETLPTDVLTALQNRFNENDPAGAAALFADDGAIMAEFGEVALGKAEIQNLLQQQLDRKMQYWITPEGSRVQGDIGYDFGSLRIRDTASGRDLSAGKYMKIYHRVDGEWKIFRAMSNSNSLDSCATVQVETDKTDQ